MRGHIRSFQENFTNDLRGCKQRMQINGDSASPLRPSMTTTGTGHACSRHLTSTRALLRNRLSLNDLSLSLSLSLSLHLLILIPILRVREPLSKLPESTAAAAAAIMLILYHERMDGARGGSPGWLTHTRTLDSWSGCVREHTVLQAG